MKLQQGATSLAITDIWVDFAERQRRFGRDTERRIGDTSDLEGSITKRGLLQPIIVERADGPDGQPWKLHVGERRLTACTKLGQEKILARKVSDLTPVEAQIIELEENVKRLDLEWQDMATGVAKIHLLYTKLDPDWTMEETGVELGLGKGTVSMYMSVHLELANPRVAEASTIREAYNMLKRREQRESGQALQDLLETPDIPPPAEVRADLTQAEVEQVEALKGLGEALPRHLLQMPKPRLVLVPPSPESILHTSFLEWAPSYSGPKFNLVHCDFPYGVELFSSPQGRGSELAPEGAETGYKDSADTYETLIRVLCANLDRVMSVSSHLMFWLSADWQIISNTVRLFNELAPSLRFTKFPLIWVKSDNAGIASDPKHGPRHVYEACLLASRGNRNIARVKGDAYSAPTDKKLHPSTKPEPMLRHFMEMLVDETTTLLDPTCGSGASLRAAESLGAKSVLGLEIDRQFVEPARLALKQARAKRAAEREQVL